jgi:hypothetical protein
MAAGGERDHTGSRDGGRTDWEQCAADARLVARFVESGFAGAEYEAFRKRLAAYGFTVLMGLIASGEIFAACALQKRPLYPRDLELQRLAVSADDRMAVAADAAMLGLALFCRTGIEGGRWSVHGGATLNTYFVNACILSFPQAFRAWRRELDHDRDCHGYGVDPTTAPGLANAAARGWTPERFVEFVEQLMELPTRERHVVVEMVLRGRTHAEIAEEMCTTPAAIAELMRRYRRRGNPRGVAL